MRALQDAASLATRQTSLSLLLFQGYRYLMLLMSNFSIVAFNHSHFLKALPTI